LVQKLLKVYSEYTGSTAKAVYCGGGTYVHGLKGVAFGPEFPNQPSHNLHGANEFIGLDELKDVTKIYARAILSICG
jgi:succinyl-diaminopimelate desuccinylase